MKFQRAGCSACRVTSVLVGNGQKKATGTSFYSFILIFIFILFYYICEIHLQNFKRLCSFTVHLWYFWCITSISQIFERNETLLTERKHAEQCKKSSYKDGQCFNSQA